MKAVLVLALLLLAGCKKHHQNEEPLQMPQYPPGGCIVDTTTRNWGQ